ncbi:serine O-acetyltransferase [Azospirillum sp.]|uniref:serine O-acetyltransferase n=1 Tax=Azospirillum sp. TaxID=34012 RepID=UPI003D74D923
MDGLITTTTEAEAWDRLRAEAAEAAAGEAMLRGVMEAAVLAHQGPDGALSACLARRLAGPDVGRGQLGELVDSALRGDPRILEAAFADLAAIVARDPAADGWLTPFLHFKGFHALQWHRVAHWLWNDGRHALAHYLQNRVSEVYAVDIHPAVPVGRGVFIDHGTGVVVGETAVIGNDVSILQNVTLGGTGKEHGDRHPKVRDGVLLSAGAKVLGNIEIGARAKVGAGSVVLKSVPPCATVAGVPARIVGWCSGMVPGVDMDQSLGDDYQNLGIDI